MKKLVKAPHHFDVALFNADFAYTMDGSQYGELQFESFNAAEATITCHGVNVHPGSAKMSWLMRFYSANNLIAIASSRGARTHRKLRRFYHLMHFNGNVEKATLQYIIRDHDRKTLNYVRRNYLKFETI